MIRNYFLLAAVVMIGASTLSAVETTPTPFNKAIVTEVVNQVERVDPSTLQGQSVAPDAVLNAPDLLRTGRRSRAQLTAEDGTVARVGANTVFSFEQDSRTINLQQGSILFNSPSGQGGGNIVTNAASASVLGTTIIVAATNNGGFKVLVMEGSAQVTFPNGVTQTLSPGQMSFVLPGGQPGPVVNFDLAKQTEGSDLLNGFSVTLPSNEIIQLSVQNQQREIEAGNLVETGLVVIGAVDRENLMLIETNNMTDLNNNVNNETRSESNVDPRLRKALTLPLVVDGESDIPSDNVFLEPVLITPEILIELGINPLLLGEDRTAYLLGVAAESITFFQEEAYFMEVDLSRFDERAGQFDEPITFFAKDFILFDSFVGFYGLNEADELGFVSNGTIYFKPDSGLSICACEITNQVDLFFETIAGVVIQDAFISNDAGSITMVAFEGSLVFDNAFVAAGSAGYSSFSANGGDDYFEDSTNYGRIELYAKDAFQARNAYFSASGSGIYIEASEISGEFASFSASFPYYSDDIFVTVESENGSEGFNFLGIQLVAGDEGSIVFQNSDFISQSGYILFDAEGSIVMENAYISNFSSLDSRVILEAEGAIELEYSQVNSSYGGSISLTGNAILLNNTTLSAARFDTSQPEASVILVARDAIETYDSSIFANIINIKAGNLVQLANAEVGNFYNETSSINIAARTVVLENVILRSNGEAASVVLSSQQGRLNVTGTSSGVLPGHVNYINTQYEGGSFSLQPAQNVTYDPISNVGGGNSASPIHVRQL